MKKPLRMKDDLMEHTATPRLLFGAAARDLRGLLQLSQRAMAERLGISPGHLWNIEHDNSRPSLDLLDRWREVFGSDFDLYTEAYVGRYGCPAPDTCSEEMS